MVIGTCLWDQDTVQQCQFCLFSGRDVSRNTWEKEEKVKESSISEGIQIHKSVTKLSSEKAFEFLAET